MFLHSLDSKDAPDNGPILLELLERQFFDILLGSKGCRQCAWTSEVYPKGWRRSQLVKGPKAMFLDTLEVQFWVPDSKHNSDIMYLKDTSKTMLTLVLYLACREKAGKSWELPNGTCCSRAVTRRATLRVAAAAASASGAAAVDRT